MARINSSIAAALIALLFTPSVSSPQYIRTTRAPELLSLEEAEILIYVLPQAQEVRKQGMDIGWELQTTQKLNQEDFYTFWVVNAKRQCVDCSVTIGYFSVNKHTAEIWEDDTVQIVTSPEIEGIQKIVRTAHPNKQDTIEKYHSRGPGTP